MVPALGITEEVEALGLRGTKKKKGKKLDEDFLVRGYPLCFYHLELTELIDALWTE